MTEGPVNLLGEKHFYPILDRIARNGSARYYRTSEPTSTNSRR